MMTTHDRAEATFRLIWDRAPKADNPFDRAAMRGLEEGHAEDRRALLAETPENVEAAAEGAFKARSVRVVGRERAALSEWPEVYREPFYDDARGALSALRTKAGIIPA